MTVKTLGPVFLGAAGDLLHNVAVSNGIDGLLAGMRPGEPLLSRAGVLGVPPRAGYVRLAVVEGAPSMSLDLQMTGEASAPDGYGSQWASDDRPGRVAVPRWNGDVLRRVQIPVELVGIGRSLSNQAGDDSVEEEWAALRAMRRPPAGGKPPRLEVSGPVPEANEPDSRWVLDAIEPVEDETLGLPARDSADNRILIAATITLLEYAPAPVATPVALTAAQKAKDRPNLIHTVKGDTLRRLARKNYQDARLWTTIRDRNGLHSWTADKEIPVGTPLKIPPKPEK